MPYACCRRTVDHTGPYVRMLLERLRNPKSLSVMPATPTAAGALEVTRPGLPIDTGSAYMSSESIRMSPGLPVMQW